MPLWTPSQDFLARLIPSFGYYHFLSKHLPPLVASFSESFKDRFPVEPFGLSDRSQAVAVKMDAQVDALFWAGMVDFVRYPHIQRFDSIPVMIHEIMLLDLDAQSRAMLSAHSERWNRAEQMWHRTFGKVSR